jgi:hypothetical protein
MVNGVPCAGCRSRAAIKISVGPPLSDKSQATFAAVRASRIWREWVQHHVSLVPGPHAGQHVPQKQPMWAVGMYTTSGTSPQREHFPSASHK